MKTRPIWALAAALVSSLALFGCDSNEPGAEGKIALGSGVEAASYKNLEMRAVVAAGKFDPSKPEFPTQVGQVYEDGSPGVWTGDLDTQDQGSVLLQRGEPLSGMTFPHDYTLGGDRIGYTNEKHWRMFVWLSKNADSHLDKAPASGDPYGVVDFDAKGCGLSGGYCGIQPGVDVTIDKTAP
jgi:hypothetical protein